MEATPALLATPSSTTIGIQLSLRAFREGTGSVLILGAYHYTEWKCDHYDSLEVGLNL